MEFYLHCEFWVEVARDVTIDDAVEIGIEEAGIYKLKGHADSDLTTSIINPCEL